jgi:hypothetical protein
VTENELRELFEEIRVGFDQLVERTETVLEALNERGAAAFKKGEYADADKILAQAQRIVSLRDNLRRSRDEWQEISQVIQPYMPPDDSRSQHLPITPLVQPYRNRTPKDAFRRPILEALVEHGGAAPMQEVLDRVEAKIPIN